MNDYKKRGLYFRKGNFCVANYISKTFSEFFFCDDNYVHAIINKYD